MKNKKAIYAILVAVIILAVGGYFYWEKNREFKLITSEEEMTKFVMSHTQEELDGYYKKVDELKANDIYGGKTPEETLQKYIDALKGGNLELANKYFDWVDQENELNDLKELNAEQLGSYIKVLELGDDFSCDTKNTQCSVHGVYDGTRIIIARFVVVEQSGLWKLKNI